MPRALFVATCVCLFTAAPVPPELYGQAAAGAPAQATAIDAASSTPKPHLHQAGAPGAGTRAMAQRLKQLAHAANPAEHPFLSEERVKLYRQRLAEARTTPEKIEAHNYIVIELLNSGQTEAALAELTAFEQLLQQAQRLEDHKALMLRFRAVASLRLAEQENCLTNHTSESCLFPIQGAGVHKLERGSRLAMEALTTLLTQFPNDLAGRWLLNLASMTLGEYPEKVRPEWLIPPRVFSSDYDIKRFPDIAAGAGLDLNGLAGGVIVDDFDGDGYLDLINSSWGALDQIRFFRNHADGTFQERTVEAGLVGLTGGLNLIQADYNNDGHLDFLVLRGAWAGSQGRIPNSLVRNNGDGAFEDVTEAAGVLSFHPTQTATWFDYDNDGWIDLFIGNETTGSEVHPCELYRNNRDGTFTETAAKAGLNVTSFVKGVFSGDYNNDGRPDLFLSIMGSANRLFRNDGPADRARNPELEWKFTDVSRVAQIRTPLYSFPGWFWDFDNDGWLDIFVAGYKINRVDDIVADALNLPHGAERVSLYRNNGNGRFTEVTQATGLYKVLHAMGCNFGDLDNDGFLDFYIGTGDPDLSTLIPNRMFRNASGRSFQDVTTSGGFGHLQKGHAIAFADLDHDGDQDIYADLGGAYSGDVYRNALFENPGHGNHWITLKLDGTKSNRAAIGARIKIVARTEAGPRAIHRVVGSGGSFGASPLRQEIGLGRATFIEFIEITWPASNTTDRIEDIAIDQFYRVKEGEAKAVASPLKTFTLKRSKTAHHHHH